MAKIRRYAAMPLAVLVGGLIPGGPLACAIATPTASALLPAGTPVTITGTITQAGAVVVKLGAVTLGNAVVVGLSWSYSWTPQLADVDAAGKTVNATVTADVGGSTATATGVLVKISYLGSVATRASVPNNFGAASGVYTNRTYHRSRDAITSLRVAWANKSLNSTGEAQNGTQTQLGEVEYGAGVFTPAAWSSASSVVAAAGTVPLSDAVSVSIPDDTDFWIASKLTGSVNVLYADGTQKLLSAGDAQQSGGTNMHSVANNGTNVTFPALIVANTTKRSILGVGDSRFVGLQDQTDAGRKGNNGDFETAFSPNYGTIRYGATGLTAGNFNASHALAVTLGGYVTDVVYNLGINDIIAGTSAASLAALTAANIAFFTALGLRVWLTTLQPAEVTTTDFYATTGNQTVGAHNAARVTYNNMIRSGSIAGAAGYFEFADLVESARDSGKYKVDGTANKYTSDGAHLTPFATSLAVGQFVLP